MILGKQGVFKTYSNVQERGGLLPVNPYSGKVLPMETPKNQLFHKLLCRKQTSVTQMCL